MSRSGDKAQGGGVGGIGRAVLDPVPCQAPLRLCSVAEPQIPGAELGCAWLRGERGPGLVAAGLGSCVLPSHHHFRALPRCQPGSRGTNQKQPEGFLASWCHLLLSPAGRAPLRLPVRRVLPEQAGGNSREMPFPPQQWPLAAPCHRLSGWEQQRARAGTGLSRPPQARTCPALPGLASSTLPACPGSPWLLPGHGDTAGERCPAGSRAWVLLRSQGNAWAGGFGMDAASPTPPSGVWRGTTVAGKGLLLSVG